MSDNDQAQQGVIQTYPTKPELVYYPDPVLRRPTEAVTQFDDELARFCQAMIEVMEEQKGVGLAAPQVGVSKSIFVTNHTGTGEDVIPDRRVWINPVIASPSGTHSYEEGCLSIPAVYGKVERPNSIDVSWQDVHGKEHRQHLDITAGDFLGVVVQHEYDHLLGKLHIDYLDAPTLTMNRRKLKDLEKTYKKRTGKRGAILRR